MSCNVCSDFKSWSHGGAQQQSSFRDKKSDSSSADSLNKSSNHTSPIPEAKKPAHSYKIECPPGYKKLANSTWEFLHTTAAYFPEKPSSIDQKHMDDLLRSVSFLYPCKPCAEHMQEEIKKKPPTVHSQASVSLWLCNFHNQVNLLLGKPIFDCSRTNERWRDGPSDGSCQTT